MISWPGAAALLIALIVAAIMRSALSLRQAQGHNPSLDGLRGFLAFGVFLHHGIVWYFYLHDGNWGRPPLVVYRELGLDCVNFFLMITSLLFVGKVIDARERPLDWLKLYAGRLLRIAPLYVLVVLALLLLVGHATGWHLQESVPALLVHIARWLMLGMAGTPPVNAYPMTGMLIAFVTWTLAYEWMFYFSLPLIAVLLRVRVRPVVLLLATASMVAIGATTPNLFFPSAFAFGAVAAFACRNERLAHVLRGRWFAALALLALVVLFSGLVPHRIAMLVEAVAFCVIACGNNLFGVLSNRAAIALGDVSYGIYLIHSLLLSAVFLFVVGPDTARGWSPLMFWGALLGIGIAVVTLSSITYRFVELPALRQSGRMAQRVRAFIRGSRAHADLNQPS